LKDKTNLFDYFNYLILSVMALSMVYPFIYVLFTSISDRYAIVQGLTKMYPSGINFRAYQMVLMEPRLLRAYFNSALYASTATITMILVTSIVAYPLSQKRMKFKKFIALYYVMTMFLSGGMIPTYLLYSKLGLVNNMLIMVLPGALGIYNLMMFKTYFENTIGPELVESAFMDGANDLYILFKIMLPLSKPIMAALGLFMFVGVWNNFFTPLIYLNKEKLQPLTIILRRLLIELDYRNLAVQAALDRYDAVLGEIERKDVVPQQAFRGASIIVTILPITMIYPFLQKYFVKGIMLGSLKG